MATAERELAAREKAVAGNRETQRSAQAAMLEKSANGIENRVLIVHRQYLIELREQETDLINIVEQQQSVVSRAAIEVEKALEMLTEATKEWQTIEKHRENWRRERRIEANRKEQKANDEIGAILHERRKIE